MDLISQARRGIGCTLCLLLSTSYLLVAVLFVYYIEILCLNPLAVLKTSLEMLKIEGD